MRPENPDLAYLWDMQEAAKEITEFLEGVNLERFQSDKMRRRAIERQLEVIGEAARRVSAAFQTAHAEIPWKLVIGQRHVIAHDYGDIIVERLYGVAANRIPELIVLLRPLIPRA
jgi:uncharacterized protein with HEPN domain